MWKSISCQLFFEGGRDNKNKKRESNALFLEATLVEFVANLPFHVSHEEKALKTGHQSSNQENKKIHFAIIFEDLQESVCRDNLC